MSRKLKEGLAGIVEISMLQFREQHKGANMKIAEKYGVSPEAVATLKNTEEWENLAHHLGDIIVDEIKEHKGEKALIIIGQIVTAASVQLRQELVDAVADSKEIPSELKNAPMADKIQFIYESLLDIGEIVMRIFTKAAS